MKIFGFECELEISTRPEEHYIGRLEDWDRAENILKTVLDERAIPYDINEGDGAFYGPKIDFKLKDALGRKWQCATIQVDFALPERFDLHYTDSDGKRKRPVMLHRVVLGAIERFMGVLIEHYAGRFPLWLAPVQVLLLTITDEQDRYSAEIRELLEAAEVRVEVDSRNEKLGLKIREGTIRKIPYLVILGKKEAETGTLSVRNRDGVEMKGVTASDFLKKVTEENAHRR
jgi:threonyl-tRNA synthetase